MRGCCASFLAALLAGCATTGEHAQFVKKPFSVPLSYIDGSFIMIPMTVNGKDTENFIRDTGISINLISRRRCARMGCARTGEHEGRRMSRQELRVPVTTLKSLGLGELRRENLEVGIIDTEALLPGQNIRGFVSLGFFDRLPFSVDSEARVLTVESRASLRARRLAREVVPARGERDGAETRRFEGKDASQRVIPRFFTRLQGVHLPRKPHAGEDGSFFGHAARCTHQR